MKIVLDNINYHLNSFTKGEKKFVATVRSAVFNQYPKLNNLINDEIKKSKIEFTKSQKDELINKLILANIKFIKDLYVDTLNTQLQDNKFFKIIYKNIARTIPYVLTLHNKLTLDRPFLYEPINVIVMNLLNSMQDIVGNISNFNMNKYQDIAILISNNIVRNLKSSLLLYSIGDDVHGCALYRGIVEQLARLIHSENFKEEFVKAIKINTLLQMKKSGTELEENDKNVLDSYLKEHKLTEISAEKYLLYGWAKKSNGKSYTNAKDFINSVMPDYYERYYHLTSEFVHEDYVGVGYDFVNMRINAQYHIMLFIVMIYHIEKELGIKFTSYEKQLYNNIKRIGHIKTNGTSWIMIVCN